MALPTKLTLHIVSPDQSISQEVDEVSLPGSEGDFGVLPGHTPFFTSLRTGAMWYRQGSDKHFLAVSVGFVEVLPGAVSVLAQVAERAEDLDQARAEAGMTRAEEVFQALPHEIDFERARLAMLRTLQQLQAESRKM
ncbi:MAG: ATP synthase F1 subunit epsilon [Acidobacteria bacterium RIFCSPLOWO2_12_FULL_67_14b]|nr:MAG: ATP synthase F1 subunit epsilon [Acidobacteria bacterium RIFCSPLOWO2_12_FULL_67_14b]